MWHKKIMTHIMCPILTADGKLMRPFVTAFMEMLTAQNWISMCLQW